MIKNIVIGGEAGQGLKTTAAILGKALFKNGFNLHTSMDFMSRIRGGHNFGRIRFGDEEIRGPQEEIDLLVALNEETITRHVEKLAKDGAVLYDEAVSAVENSIVVPAEEIASEVNPKAVNTVYVGSILKAFGINLDCARSVVEDYFDAESVISDNLKLLNRGYEKGETIFKAPEPKSRTGEQIYLNGNEATALGALAGGINYYSAYPMSPATGIMSYIAGKQDEMNVVVEQAEDELAAINMAIGASYGGIRTMSGTSGGGLALMNEAIGLAGLTETPLVVANVQRPGPATGLPTRTSQGDLLFAVNSAQGEFPLLITASRNQENAFYQTFRALNLADKYQLPVILMSDQFLADSSTNVPDFELQNLEIERNLIAAEDMGPDEEYRRYEFTEDGISPRAFPGQLKKQTVLADSDEHDEKGHIVEAADKRRRMVDKRARKLDRLIEDDLAEPEYFGPENIDYLLVGWGSTYGPLREAQSRLNEEDIKAGYLSFTDVWPLPTTGLEKLADNEVELIDVENNSQAQFARLIRQETGIEVEHRILKYDGRPFRGEEIFRRITEEVIQ